MDGTTRVEKMQAERPRAALFGAGGLPYAAIAALQKHPGFETACREFTRGAIDLYQGNRLLNTLVNDRGRMVIGNLALYLHYGCTPDDPRSGLTMSRLKTLCIEQNVCSTGRTEAIVAVMRLLGYLEAAPDVQDRRVRRLVPTERMIESYRNRWSLALAAIGHVLPVGKAAHNAMTRDEFPPALVHQLAEHYLAGLRLLHHSTELSLFADRNAGILIMFSLLQAGAPGDEFPPRKPLDISISALSRRFGVSRVHVRKLLSDAAAQGFIARPDGAEGPIVLLPKLATGAQNFLATTFLYVAHCARAALDEIDESAD